MLALFGPSDLLLGSHIQSLCDALDIPHLEARSFQDFLLAVGLTLVVVVVVASVEWLVSLTCN